MDEPPKRLLIIDDRARYINGLSHKLTLYGIPTIVGSLEEFHDQITLGPLEFDAFLTDLLMPGFGTFSGSFGWRVGFKVAVAARRHFSGPIGIFSGSMSGTSELAEGCRFHSIKYLNKDSSRQIEEINAFVNSQ